MARRTFFSFHFESDIFRANVVRNSNTVRPNHVNGNTFFDASLWEAIKLKGVDALKRLIADGLNNTSVTAVLIGSDTASRPWVQYEIEESMRRGNGLLGVRIHNVKGIDGRTSSAGVNPYDEKVWDRGPWRGYKLSSTIKVYDWVLEDGYTQIPSWIDAAWLQAKG